MFASRRIGPSLVAIVIFCAAYLVLSALVSNSYYQLILTLVPIYAVFGLSWNLISGYGGVVSFGHAAFFGLGAYTVTLLMVTFFITPWIGIAAAVLVGAVAAALIGYLTFHLRGVYFALAMLAYPLVLMYVFSWLGWQELTLPMQRENPARYMQFDDHWLYIVVAIVMLATALLISLAIELSRFGMSLIAIKQDEFAAEAAGIDTWKWKMRALILSGALAAAAGGFYATVLLVVTPESVFGMLQSAQAMVVTLFGGIGTMWGPVVGSILLIPLSETLNAHLGHLFPGIQGVVYGFALILIILTAPDGLYWRVHDFISGRRENSPVGATPDTGQPLSPPARPSTGSIASTPFLKVVGLSRSFGGLKAVDDVSFEAERGMILGIIGPNGAGKTTLFNLINGFLRPNSGQVFLESRDLVGLKPNLVCHCGVGRTFQVVRAFQRMSVLENVVVGAFVASRTDQEAIARAHHALTRVGLEGKAGALVSTLTNVELRMMELARALASGPKLILLDETLAGLGSTEIERMLATIKGLPGDGTTIIIIEHTMHAMMRLADRLLVLDHGRVIADREPSEVIKDRNVVEAYLGKKWMAAGATN